jgi:hypothetical protein
MITMSKTTFLAGAFLFVTSLVTVSASAAGPCPHYRDPGSCNYDYSCFWDTDDQRCEVRGNEGGYCASVTSPYYCNGRQGCFWDTDDQRCEPR